MMFSKILIANRGEIACRVIRTARKLGVKTEAVYSDADARALHVAMADEAVHIGPSPMAESYLRGDVIIAAAKATGAEAIHPGYGFLSENPDFVDQVIAAGLVFIGPSAASIRTMGLKDAAKQFMKKAGVPILPGYHGEAQEIVILASKAREIGYPVLIKARSGGGGKGMRRVDHPDDFADALSGARHEAKAAFGDDHVLVEKYVDKPRHIEVQLFGDNFGNVVHLFERDCSAQRRHQKVIEEAPAPGMTTELRAAMTNAAVKAAKAINYSGAGTIEFIVDTLDGLKPNCFWFMEMNTRLQVEHPVTEMITGVDLVEWQLRVASGEVLPAMQEDIQLSGHAFEARLYAEDPAKDFLPTIGTLHHLTFPAETVVGTELMVETSVRPGDTISPYYDPMIVKLITHGPDRATALAALVQAVEQTEVAGCVTNATFLAALATDPDFVSGNVDTGLIGRKQEMLITNTVPSSRATALAALAAAGAKSTETAIDPWSSLHGYAHFNPMSRKVLLAYDGTDIVTYVSTLPDGRFEVTLEGNKSCVLKVGTNDTAGATVAVWPGHITVFENGCSFDFAISDPFARVAEIGEGTSSMRAPMPGLIKLVRVAHGNKVSKGQPLMLLEAMKMEHTIAATHDGVIQEIVTEGTQVIDGMVLVRFEE